MGMFAYHEKINKYEVRECLSKLLFEGIFFFSFFYQLSLKIRLEAINRKIRNFKSKNVRIMPLKLLFMICSFIFSL